MIQPKVLKGFRDSLPRQEIIKKEVIATLEKTFSTYGFVLIDTPALEYTEVLLGKGGGETDKQIFHFLDNGGRDVALRFDLTVPFARFMATHTHHLQLPFKRFHVAKVWRGENPQKGRYREFFQCDFDIVGIDSLQADVEIVTMIHSALVALDVEKFTILLSHRGILNELLASLGVENHSTEILRIIDKISKIGADAVQEQLITLLQDQKTTDTILKYIHSHKDNTPFETLEEMRVLIPSAETHINHLQQLLTYVEHLGIEDRFTIDPSITRGLDYYTGIVYETLLDDLPDIGSICSGGRYNDLASLYTKQHLPGVGASIGLDRLLTALEELDHPLVSELSASDVIIFNQDEELSIHYHKTAHLLRKEGISTLLLLETKKMGPQFKYAQAHHIPYGLYHTEQGQFTLRHLESRTDYPHLKLEDVVEHLKRM